MSEPVNPYASPQADAAIESASLPAGTADLRLVYVGLSLVYWGIIAMLLGVMALIAYTFIREPNVSIGIEIPIILSVGLIVCLGAITALVGQCFCLFAPADSRARPWVFAALALQVISVLVGFAFSVIELPILLELVNPLLSFLAMGAFVFALLRLAEYIQSLKIRIQAQRVLTVGVILLAMVFAGTLMMNRGAGGILPALFSIGIVLTGLLLFVMYVNLINALRKALRPSRSMPAVEGTLEGSHTSE